MRKHPDKSKSDLKQVRDVAVNCKLTWCLRNTKHYRFSKIGEAYNNCGDAIFSNIEKAMADNVKADELTFNNWLAVAHSTIDRACLYSERMDEPPECVGSSVQGAVVPPAPGVTSPPGPEGDRGGE